MSTDTVSLFFAILTVVADAIVLVAALLAIGARLSLGMAAKAEAARDWIAPSALGFAWLVALVATLGSLYYSEFADFVPCKLCWYQRIAMYPLAVVLGIAAFKRDTAIRRYALPVAAIGAVIAAYHYQLERLPHQTSLGCTLEEPCNVTLVWQFHFISIPFMALSGFALIITLLWALRGHERVDDELPAGVDRPKDEVLG